MTDRDEGCAFCGSTLHLESRCPSLADEEYDRLVDHELREEEDDERTG